MRSPIVLKSVRLEVGKILTVIILVAFFALPAYCQLAVPLTIQEALYPGAPTTGIARSQDPVTVGVPIADSSRITSTSQLGLSGATVGQFRVLGRWPSGNIMWVQVDTQADVPAGGKNTSVFLTTGSGNFGGSNLAVDNGGSITVNTGPAQFTIRKANFNLFDSVMVNGKQLVAPGTSAGLVMMGPAPGATSCGVCNVPYASVNDPASTAVIEENGPARASLRVSGSHVDSAGHAYMHYTVRMQFYKGKAYAKVEVILRNADETTNTAGDFNSAFKGFASYEARITPALGSGRHFNIGSDTPTSVSGSFSGTENAYLYQAYSKDMEWPDWNITNCSPTVTGRCTVSYIGRTTTSGSNGSFTYSYAQDGYQIVHGSSVLLQANHTKYPQGWADLSDSTGAGIEVAFTNWRATGRSRCSLSMAVPKSASGSGLTKACFRPVAGSPITRLGRSIPSTICSWIFITPLYLLPLTPFFPTSIICWRGLPSASTTRLVYFRFRCLIPLRKTIT